MFRQFLFFPPRMKILHGPCTASVICRRGLWMMQVNIWPWSPHLLLEWFQLVLKYAIKSKFTFSGYLASWSLMTFDLDLCPFDCMNIWKFPYYINKPSLVPIQLQLFKWGQCPIFSLSYNLISDDLWPWHVTFDLINKWGFPCYICDPTLVEIIRACGSYSQMLTCFHNRQQQCTKWPLCVFPARAGNTKMMFYYIKK